MRERADQLIDSFGSGPIELIEDVLAVFNVLGPL
jgi:hypothetical protein